MTKPHIVLILPTTLIRSLKHTLLLLLVIILSACAAGQTVNYGNGQVNYETGLDQKDTVVIAFMDNRPYVRNGSKPPSFVGLSRSLAGIPYPVNTQSGQPLANDFAQLVANSLQAEGLDARSATFALQTSLNEFIKQNTGAGQKLLIFTLNDWKTDAYTRVNLHYNVDLAVYNETGEKLAAANTKGKEALGKDQPENRRTLVAANTDIIGGLLKQPQIKAAIANGIPEKTDSETGENSEYRRCTAQQVLNMKGSGLSDQQILAACR